MRITQVLMLGLLATVLPVQFAVADADGERSALAQIDHEFQAIEPLIDRPRHKPIPMPAFAFSMTGCVRTSIAFASGFRITSMPRVPSPGLSRHCVAITAGDGPIMTAAQNTAFQAGSGVTPATLLTGIASVVLVLAFIWVIWVALGTFRAWQNGQVVLFDVIWSALRASIVLMVLGFYLR